MKRLLCVFAAASVCQYERKHEHVLCITELCCWICVCLWCVAAIFFFSLAFHILPYFSIGFGVWTQTFFFVGFIDHIHKQHLCKIQPYFLFHFHAKLIYVFSNIYGFYLFLLHIQNGIWIGIRNVFAGHFQFLDMTFMLLYWDEVISFEFCERTLTEF